MSNTIYVENASFVVASVIAAIFHPSFKSIKTWTNNIGCTAILGIKWTCKHISIYSPRTNYLHLHILPDWHQVHLVHWRRGRRGILPHVDKSTLLDIIRLLVLAFAILPAKSFNHLVFYLLHLWLDRVPRRHADTPPVVVNLLLICP